MKVTVAVMLAVLLSFSVTGVRGEMILVENGVPNVGLRVSEDAGPETIRAAAAMAEYVEKISGARIDNVENPKGTIFLGAEYAADFGVDLRGLKYSGYVIRSKDSNILIAGGNDAATARGVYGFLSDYLGVRWYGPGPLWEVVPEEKTIRVPELDLRCEPDFGYRIFTGMDGEEGVDWCRRNRLDLRARDIPYFGFGHNMRRILPPATYAESNPEYYALIGDKRRVPTKENPETQPCFSNPQLVEITLEAARQLFEDSPERTTFSLGTNDNPYFCRCPDCAELDSPKRTSKAGNTNVREGWTIHSESYYRFVARVAEKLAETHPDKFVGCYAYWNVELPPRNIEKLPPNVVIAHTQETSQHFDPEYKAADRELWLAWNKVATHLGKYDYYGLGGWITPRYFPTLAADDIKFIHANGAIGFYTSINLPYYMMAPKIYMTAQLLWKADQDAKEILNSYFTNLYGEAAPDMKEFYDILERYWTQPRKGYWLQGGNLSQEFGIVNLELLDEALDCLIRARHKVTEQELDRVKYVATNFAFSHNVAHAYVHVGNLDTLPLETEEDVLEFVRHIEAAVAMVNNVENTYQNVVVKDSAENPMYSLAARFNSKYSSVQDYFKDNVQKAVGRLEKDCTSIMEPEVARIVISDLRAQLASDTFGSTLGFEDEETD